MKRVAAHALVITLCGTLLLGISISSFLPPLLVFGTGKYFYNLGGSLLVPDPGFAYMSLLALQFACQPTTTKTFAPPHMIRSTYVMSQEVVRFLVCAVIMMATGSFPQQWSLSSSLAASAPAALYAIQNYACLMAAQTLDPISYNVLNQTKTLSAAFFCYVLLGKPQSKLQIMALLILLGSALVIEKVVPIEGFRGRGSKLSTSTLSPKSRNKDTGRNHLMMGVLPILLGSLVSGLAGTLCQKSLHGRDPFLFSMELSTFTLLTLLASLVTGINPDGPKLVSPAAAMVGWTWKTWIPIFTSAMGGLLTTLVTAHVGAVRKGFALIFGLLLSGLVQDRVSSSSNNNNKHQGHHHHVTTEQWVGGGFAALSLWMHASYPLQQQPAAW